MYFLVDKDGNKYGPIVCDDPRRDTYRDRSIRFKVSKWAKILDYEWTTE